MKEIFYTPCFNLSETPPLTKVKFSPKFKKVSKRRMR